MNDEMGQKIYASGLRRLLGLLAEEPEHQGHQRNAARPQHRAGAEVYDKIMRETLGLT